MQQLSDLGEEPRIMYTHFQKLYQFEINLMAIRGRNVCTNSITSNPTIKPTVSLMLKLYFNTQFIITPTYFDLC